MRYPRRKYERSNLSAKEPEWLWKPYLLRVQIEAVFRSLKNDFDTECAQFSAAFVPSLRLTQHPAQ